MPVPSAETLVVETSRATRTVGTAGQNSHEWGARTAAVRAKTADSAAEEHPPVGSAVQDNGQQTETFPVERRGAGRRGADGYPVADCPTLGETVPLAGRQNSRHVVLSVLRSTSGDPQWGPVGVSLRLAASRRALRPIGRCTLCCSLASPALSSFLARS